MMLIDDVLGWTRKLFVLNVRLLGLGGYELCLNPSYRAEQTSVSPLCINASFRTSAADWYCLVPHFKEAT